MTALAKTILIVEDEPKIAAILRDYLRAEGYLTVHIEDGNAVVASVRAAMPDVILLDVMLPGKDGLTLCRELRAFSTVPIIMLTARVEEIDRLLGLELGADDYVCKPFSSREVVARVKALLRRTAISCVVTSDAGSSATVVVSAPIKLDAARFSASVRGVMLELTPVEFRLLQTLAAQAGRVFSRNQLMDLLYVDHRIVSDRTVDSHVKNLRRKIVEAGGEEDWLRSIYGMGYKLDY